MVKIVVEYYDVSVKMLIPKKYWDADNGVMDADTVKDKIQQGIECPIDSIDVVVKL